MYLHLGPSRGLAQDTAVILKLVRERCVPCALACGASRGNRKRKAFSAIERHGCFPVEAQARPEGAIELSRGRLACESRLVSTSACRACEDGPGRWHGPVNHPALQAFVSGIQTASLGSEYVRSRESNEHRQANSVVS